MTVAVLFADSRSHYHDLPGVDVYDRNRNALTYRGGAPVVAHPPCRSWSAFLRHQAKPKPGEMELARWAVRMVQQNGGILEHPAHSKLWLDQGLPEPPIRWDSDWDYTLQVNQRWWGDSRDKATWLYCVGIDVERLDIPIALSPGNSRNEWNKLSRRKRALTPPAMAQWLVDLARTAHAPQQA